MKRIFLSLAGLCMIGCAHTFAAPTAPTHTTEDTIVITMPDKSKMVIYVQNRQNLKNFRNYNIDSLIASLDVYIREGARAGSDTTISIGRGKANQVTVNVSGSRSKDKARETEIDRRIAEIDRQIDDIERQRSTGDMKVKDLISTAKEQTALKKEKDRLEEEKRDMRTGDSRPITARIESVDENGNTKVTTIYGSSGTSKASNTKPPKPWFSEFGIDLGFNNFHTSDTYRNQLGQVVDYDLKPFGSRYVSLNWQTGSRIGSPGSPFRIQSGLEFNFNNFMWDNNIRIASQDNQVVFFKEEELNLNKSKLAVTYLTVPLMAGVQYKSENGKDGFRFMAGGYAGYRIHSHTKIKYADTDGDTKKSKGRGSYNLQDYQYGVGAQIGYRGFNLFTKYNLSDLFKENRGPQAQVINFGLSF